MVSVGDGISISLAAVHFMSPRILCRDYCAHNPSVRFNPRARPNNGLASTAPAAAFLYRGGLSAAASDRRMFVTATRRSCRTACATSAALSEAKGCWCRCADVDFISHPGSASHIIAAVCCSRRARACCHHRSSAPAFTAATATEWHSFWQQRAAFAADVAAREMQRELGRSHQ